MLNSNLLKSSASISRTGHNGGHWPHILRWLATANDLSSSTDDLTLGINIDWLTDNCCIPRAVQQHLAKEHLIGVAGGFTQIRRCTRQWGMAQVPELPLAARALNAKKRLWHYHGCNLNCTQIEIWLWIWARLGASHKANTLVIICNAIGCSGSMSQQ